MSHSDHGIRLHQRATALCTAALLLLAAAPGSAFERPNAALTPGAGAAVSVAQVCERGYARRARAAAGDDRRLYDAVMDAYHVPYAMRNERYYRLDHLWPIEAGGASAVANEWPQPTDESLQKDAVENALHAAICFKRGYRGVHLTPAEAGREISRDWTKTAVGLPPAQRER